MARPTVRRRYDGADRGRDITPRSDPTPQPQQLPPQKLAVKTVIQLKKEACALQEALGPAPATVPPAVAAPPQPRSSSAGPGLRPGALKAPSKPSAGLFSRK